MKALRSRYVAAAFALAIVLALGGAGCGSGGDDRTEAASGGGPAATSGDATQASNSDATQPSEGPSLTKTAFIKQADALCRKADQAKQEDVDAFGKETGVTEGKPLTPALEKRFILDVAMPPIQVEAEELRALGPPEEPEAEAILDGLEKAIEEAEAKAKDGEATDTFTDVAKQARQYGFKACILYY